MKKSHMQFLKEKVQEQPVIVGILVLFFAVFVGYIFLGDNDEEFAKDDLLGTEELMLGESASSSQEVEWIYVDIKGEVNYPGVYQVDVDCRLLDLIDKAGGLTSHANDKQINLAQKLTDQAMIIIPSIEEAAEEQVHQEVLEIVQTPDSQAGKININTAGVEELTSLSGIGIKKAQQIIEYREQNGSFKTVNDLVNVSGIGQKTVDKLQSEVCVQ